ncbi:MAG TPA: sigma 54-interacting transcriptional regulator, partial [Planctomycetota bacterium]|nr:sigma 54-interacting transcriptional regulator [Planctomycetota bacterium]
MASDEGSDLRLLLVDADTDLRGLLTRRLVETGYEVHASGETTGIAARAASEHFDLALIEVFAPERRWLELLKELRAADAGMEVVVITARDAADVGTEACRLGAFATLQRPCPFEHLQAALGRAAERAGLRRETALLRDELRRHTGPDAIAGESPAARGLRDLVDRAARSDAPVLVEGRPGTDRDRVARSLHARSTRCDAPFVTFRPAAAERDRMRSELFGHVQGAFDGAVSEHRGLLDRARGGTVFIDDAADLDGGSQTELARLV